MNYGDLETLIDYHYWARDRLLDAAGRLTPQQLTQDLGNSFPSILDTLRHLIGAEIVWRSRWSGESPETMPALGDVSDLEGVRRAWTVEEWQVRQALADRGKAGVSGAVQYTGFNKQAQAQPFEHTLQHLVNHGTYHRGQITTMLRQLRVEPPKSMDLITFYRERAAIGY